MRRFATLAASLLLLMAPPAFSQVEEVQEGGVEHVTAAAQLTLAYDDGEKDDGVRPFAGDQIEYAMRFTAPATMNPLLELRICLSRNPADRSTGDIGVVLYSDVGGRPGGVIAGFSATPVDVTTDRAGKFHLFDLRPFDVRVPRNFFVGVRLNRADTDYFLCVDHDGAGVRPAIYWSPDLGAWENYRDHRPEVEAFMIRSTVEGGAAPPPGPHCNAGGDAVDLLSGRFRVDVCWRTSDGKSGVGRLAGRQGSGATLWFFRPDNPEMFVKVRDACVAPFNRYWFFAAGLTNVEVTLTVTDTLLGKVKTYTNPMGRAYVSVQDTGTFDTCP